MDTTESINLETLVTQNRVNDVITAQLDVSGQRFKSSISMEFPSGLLTYNIVSETAHGTLSLASEQPSLVYRACSGTRPVRISLAQTHSLMRFGTRPTRHKSAVATVVPLRTRVKTAMVMAGGERDRTGTDLRTQTQTAMAH